MIELEEQTNYDKNWMHTSKNVIMQPICQNLSDEFKTNI